MADERRTLPADPADAAAMDALLTRTLETYASRATPAADALARMEARLDAASPARPSRALWPRWVVAGAVALLLLILVSPAGRTTAASVAHAARSVIVAVRDTVTGGTSNQPTPALGTAPTGTNAPGSATAGSGSATAPAASGVTGTVTNTVRSGSAPANTPAGTATATRPATPTASPPTIPAAASVPGALQPAATPAATATTTNAARTASPTP